MDRHDALVATAAAALNPHRSGDRLFGDVAAALVSSDGETFTGVCIDTGSGTGFCAEHAAIAAMVTARRYVVDTIVAVWRDDDGTLYVLPPYGRCREFLRQVDQANLDTRVVLGRDESLPLHELLPRHEWPTGRIDLGRPPPTPRPVPAAGRRPPGAAALPG